MMFCAVAVVECICFSPEKKRVELFIAVGPICYKPTWRMLQHSLISSGFRYLGLKIISLNMILIYYVKI